MKITKALSLKEAQALQHQYNLVIHQLKNTYDTLHSKLECIAVAPADILNKWFFVNYYMESRDNDTALQFYKHDAYDVIAIIHHVHEDGEVEYTYKSIDTLLKERLIKLTKTIKYEGYT
jgi:hypothetical protein